MDDGRNHDERKGTHGRQCLRADHDMRGSSAKMINPYLEDVVWPIRSARSGLIYNVEMTKRGLRCNCIAGTYGRKCKHAKYVTGLLMSDDDKKYDIF